MLQQKGFVCLPVQAFHSRIYALFPHLGVKPSAQDVFALCRPLNDSKLDKGGKPLTKWLRDGLPAMYGVHDQEVFRAERLLYFLVDALHHGQQRRIVHQAIQGQPHMEALCPLSPEMLLGCVIFYETLFFGDIQSIFAFSNNSLPR